MPYRGKKEAWLEIWSVVSKEIVKQQILCSLNDIFAYIFSTFHGSDFSLTLYSVW